MFHLTIQAAAALWLVHMFLLSAVITALSMNYCPECTFSSVLKRLEHMEVYLDFHQSGKWKLLLILSFLQPFHDHISGLTCVSFSVNDCTVCEGSGAQPISELSSDWIMLCGSTLLCTDCRVTVSLPWCCCCVSLYTSSACLSHLLWWTWVCVVNPVNDLWLRLSRSPEHVHATIKTCLLPLFLSWKEGLHTF